MGEGEGVWGVVCVEKDNLRRLSNCTGFTDGSN